MKIRIDFVTNSSSSSFVIVGVKDLDFCVKSFNALWNGDNKYHERSLDQIKLGISSSRWYSEEDKEILMQLEHPFCPGQGVQDLKDDYVAIGSYENDYPSAVGYAIAIGDGGVGSLESTALDNMSLLNFRKVVAEYLSNAIGESIPFHCVKLIFGETGE